MSEPVPSSSSSSEATETSSSVSSSHSSIRHPGRSSINDMYSSEIQRRCSFDFGDWGVEILNSRELARDGFYYLGYQRMVRCHFCDFTTSASIYGEPHWLQHRRATPRCPFIWSTSPELETSNRPIYPLTREQLNPSEARESEFYWAVRRQQEGQDVVGNDNNLSETSMSNQNDLLSDVVRTINDTADQSSNENGLPSATPTIRTRILPGTPLSVGTLRESIAHQNSDARSFILQHNQKQRVRRNRARKSKMITAPEHKVNRRIYTRPKFPAMRCVEARKISFKNWPANNIITGDSLAVAGFFYSGVFDHVRCYQCNITLADWNENDDAWVNHAYYSPKCSFVYLQRGQFFVDGIASSNESGEPVSELPTASTDVDRYTCKVCLDKEVGCVFAPCDHAVVCVDCVNWLEACPICKTSLTEIYRMKLIS